MRFHTQVTKWSKLFGLGLTIVLATYFGIETLLTDSNAVWIPIRRNDSNNPAALHLEVALIGDSLSKDFHIDHPLSMIWSSRTRRRGGWFLGHSMGSSRPGGFLDRIAERASIRGTSYATASAFVDGQNAHHSWLRMYVGRAASMSEQVDRMLSASAVPDLVLIWMGHNNLDWKTFGNNPSDFPSIARQIVASYKDQVQRILVAATGDGRRHAIVVMGLINFRAYFPARDMADTLHRADSGQFPFLEAGYGYFPSLRPEYREKVIELADHINQNLEVMVTGFQSLATDRIHLKYSRAMSDMAIESADILSPQDAWHPSQKGQDLFAATVGQAVEPILRELGMP